MSYNSVNKKDDPVSPTFYGYIETTRDALLIFEACKRGLLPRVKRRLQDKEKILIRSGTIFCFDGKESGIKRWTDGFLWSPSRIMGNFLIYRELQDKKLSYPDENKSLIKNSPKYKTNGLIKKAITILVDGVHQHIISYYTKQDILSCKLISPSSLIELASLQVSPGLKLPQNFRIPVKDNTDNHGRNNKRKYSILTNEDDFVSPSSSTTSSSVDSTISLIPIINNHEHHMIIPESINLMLDSSLYNHDTQTLPSCPETNKQNDIIHSITGSNLELATISGSSHPQDVSICLDVDFGNLSTPTSQYAMASSSSSGYGYFNEFDQRNPYQHLYSSTSFHSINHASILPKNNNIITANAFMEDINAVLGWNEFELQM